MRSDECASCRRRRVPLIVRVIGRVYAPDGRRWDDESRGWWGGRHEEWPLALRSRAVCLDRGDCIAYQDRKRERQRQRGALPADAVLVGLHPAQGGRCKWCGEAIYRKNRDGRIVIARQRMWHDGRTVDPRAEPEPRCVQEYNAQGFTFRGQVHARDGGVCAGCGRDVDAEHAGWETERRALMKRQQAEERDGFSRELYRAHDAEMRRWRVEHPEPRWHADHVVPLEDGGEHTLANAQTLCGECHTAKTAQENSARAARRRGDAPDRQERLSL